MTAARTTLLAASLGTLLAAGLAGCDRPTPLPDAAVSRQSLAFEAPGGTAEPAAQTFFVTNAGRGALDAPAVSIEYQDGAGWLGTAVSGAAAPYEVRVWTSTASLAPGTYQATLTVSVGNAASSPLQVPVTLAVPDPRFTLSTSALAFTAPRGGGNPAPQQVQVTNGGRGTLPVPGVQVSYVGLPGWLDVEVDGDPSGYAVTVHADVTGLDSGTYHGTLAVSATGAAGPPRTLGVSLVVPPTEVALSKGELRFEGPAYGSDPEPAFIEVTNGGGGKLEVPVASVSYAEAGVPPWLEVVVSGDAAPYTLALQARQSRATVPMERGTYHATVTVSAPEAGNPPQQVVVTFVVPPPIVAIGPSPYPWAGFASLFACGNPPDQELTVFNAGPGTLERPTIQVDQGSPEWLAVTLSGDQAPYTLTLRVFGPPPSERRSASVTATAAGSVLAATAAVTWDPPPATLPDQTSYITPRSVAFHAQVGAGDPGPRTVDLWHRAACFPSLERQVLTYDQPAWLTTEVTSDYTHNEVTIRPSAAGMTHGGFRYSYLVFPTVVPDSYSTNSIYVNISASDFVPAQALGVALVGHRITATASGRLVVTGGGAGWDTTRSRNPSATWFGDALMRTGRHDHGTVAINGGTGVLVCGGRNDAYYPGLVQSCEWFGSIYGDYVPGSWIPAGSLWEARVHPSLVALGDTDKVLVVSAGQQQAEIVDWFDKTSSRSPVVNGASGTGVLLPDGRVLVAGGTDEAAIYDPATDAWVETGPMGTVRPHPALHVLPDGRVLAVGGGEGIVSAEVWSPETGEWTPTGAPRNAHDDTNTASLTNGKVVAVASISLAAPSSDVELYDPASGTWSVAASLGQPRFGMAVARAASGEIVAAGGAFVDQGQAVPSPETFTW